MLGNSVGVMETRDRTTCTHREIVSLGGGSPVESCWCRGSSLIGPPCMRIISGVWDWSVIVRKTPLHVKMMFWFVDSSCRMWDDVLGSDGRE